VTTEFHFRVTARFVAYKDFVRVA